MESEDLVRKFIGNNNYTYDGKIYKREGASKVRFEKEFSLEQKPKDQNNPKITLSITYDSQNTGGIKVTVSDVETGRNYTKTFPDEKQATEFFELMVNKYRFFEDF